MSGQAQSRSEQAQSSSADEAIQFLLNKSKIEKESKPIDKKKQKKLEKSLESIRWFNQINEEIAKTKQREKSMRE